MRLDPRIYIDQVVQEINQLQEMDSTTIRIELSNYFFQQYSILHTCNLCEITYTACERSTKLWAFENFTFGNVLTQYAHVLL